eukprot:SAG11_NODE_11225_length_775_cov_1.131657_1_plen_96_part_10
MAALRIRKTHGASSGASDAALEAHAFLISVTAFRVITPNLDQTPNVCAPVVTWLTAALPRAMASSAVGMHVPAYSARVVIEDTWSQVLHHSNKKKR